MTIISFLSYEDFVSELAEFEDLPAWHDQDKVVRVQESCLTMVSSQVWEMETVKITVAAQCNGTIITANIPVGQVWNYEEDKTLQIFDKTQTLKTQLVTDLTQRGYTVRPGIIVGTEQTNTKMNADVQTFALLKKEASDAR